MLMHENGESVLLIFNSLPLPGDHKQDYQFYANR